MSFVSDVVAATFRNATPLVYGTIGETYCERAGILNLGIEGTMYGGAFFGFYAAQTSGSLLVGLLVAIGVGLGAGALMGLLTVTFGTNQHGTGNGFHDAILSRHGAETHNMKTGGCPPRGPEGVEGERQPGLRAEGLEPTARSP